MSTFSCINQASRVLTSFLVHILSKSRYWSVKHSSLSERQSLFSSFFIIMTFYLRWMYLHFPKQGRSIFVRAPTTSDPRVVRYYGTLSYPVGRRKMSAVSPKCRRSTSGWKSSYGWDRTVSTTLSPKCHCSSRIPTASASRPRPMTSMGIWEKTRNYSKYHPLYSVTNAKVVGKWRTRLRACLCTLVCK